MVEIKENQLNQIESRYGFHIQDSKKSKYYQYIYRNKNKIYPNK